MQEWKICKTGKKDKEIGGEVVGWLRNKDVYVPQGAS